MSAVIDSSVTPVTSGRERVNAGDAELVAAADRERQAMAGETIRTIGVQDDIRGRVVRIGIHRVGAIRPTDVGKRTSSTSTRVIVVGATEI